MGYKFAHLADVHWRGLSRHDEYKRSFTDAFEKMKDEEVDAIFIAGDIVHSKTQGISPELIDCLAWWFKSMSDIAPTYVALGNHDGLIMNKDREDAISPIIRALNLPNLHLLKDSKITDHDENVEIANFGCFDEDGWSNLNPSKEKISIALYHGAVKGSKTDVDWELDGEVDINIFDNYDFVFLGDIHKHQYLDEQRRVAYCGSTIQQNYGESADKGFMIWEINSREDFSSKHVKVKHDRPYVTVDWSGSVNETLDKAEEFPDFSKFRVRTSIPISQGEIRQLFSALKEFKSASEIVIKHDVKKSESDSEVFSVSKNITLQSPALVSSMIKDYYKKAGLSDRMNDRLDELVHKFWKTAVTGDRAAGTRWNLKSLKFDNTFGYGKENIINFENLNGITGIFGRNRIGKSSICGTIMYTLFNTTDRGSISNLHVINSRKGHCKSSAVISKAGKNYLIERQTVKKQNRYGKVSATTHLNLFEVDEGLNIISDLCGEQRRETEKVIRKIVGNPEDFLLTSLASQGEMSAFLKQKASARKTVLSKFLELDIFERLNEAARSESSGIKQNLNSAPERDYEITLHDLKNKFNAKTLQRDEVFAELETKRSSARKLELTLATRGDSNLVTEQDIVEQNLTIKRLRAEKSSIEESVRANESILDGLIQKTQKINNFKSQFQIDDLKQSLQEQIEIEASKVKIKHGIDKEKQVIKSLEKEVLKLEDKPCSSECPVNKYIAGALKAQKLLQKKNTSLQLMRDDLNATNKALKKIESNNLREKIDKFNELIEKLHEITKEKSALEIKLNNDLVLLEKIDISLRKSLEALDDMKANISTDAAADQIRQLKQKLRDINSDCARLEEVYSAASESIGLLQSEIATTKQKKEEFEKLKEEWRVFELFCNATSKNGVPLEVIRARLPEINAEIASILQGVTGFTVELESDEGSNEMNIYINYGDSRRIIECCSGMEKMMSAIAIRVALTNVSSLPKANLLIIDEGFGALDSGNVEACSRFLQALKKWFQCILIISHVDAIKDSVDNVLEISRKGPDARVTVT